MQAAMTTQTRVITCNMSCTSNSRYLLSQTYQGLTPINVIHVLPSNRGVVRVKPPPVLYQQWHISGIPNVAYPKNSE